MSRSAGQRGRRGARAWLTLACAAPALAAPWLLPACERTADIRNEPDSGLIGPEPGLDAGDIPELDSGLGGDAFPLCADRPVGECAGPVDFPCQFEDWMRSTAESCQEATGCKTNGWLEVSMGADGCVTTIGMDQPNDEMVACLLATYGAQRCPCGELTLQLFFGLGNTGTCP